MVHNVDFISDPKHAFWEMTTPLLILTLFEAAYSFIDLFWVSHE
jgi:Na+-driven multidrug efflux pump